MGGFQCLWAAGLEFATPLNPFAWAVLAGVPVGIIALYFLKLRRRPVQVPSTLLWRRSLEDLHVNSLFQRLRRNLLLFLQLLAIGLAMLALAGPKVEGLESQGARIVIAIDESASMAATDVEPNRLEEAKSQARKIIDAMRSNDLTMIVAFSNRARVVANYTSNRDLLKRRLDAIRPTQAPTSLREALQLVAGLANPQRYMEPGEGVVATSVVPPRLFLFTDGGFPDVEGFSLGTIQPEVVVIGPPLPPAEAAKPGEAVVDNPPSDNVAILALETSRDKRNPDIFHVFGRVHNYRDEPVETRAILLRRDPDDLKDEGTLVDAVGLTMDPQSDQGFDFTLEEPGAGALEVRLEVEDALPLDDRAYATFGRPRRAQVLLVTDGNRYLSDALDTSDAKRFAEVVEMSPDEARTDAVGRDLAAGRYDVVILDRARLDTPPEASTLSLGILPVNLAETPTKPVEYPVVLDWDATNPILQYVRDLNRVVIAQALAVEPPRGASELIQSSAGLLGFTIPRGAYLDAVLTFPILEGGKANTNWVTLYSFPLFVLNTLRVLGHADSARGGESHEPGQPVVTRPRARSSTTPPTPPGSTAPAGARTSARPSPSTCSAPARATSPPGARSLPASPATRPTGIGSRSATTPWSRSGSTPPPRKNGGGRSPWRRSASFCWSGISTIVESMSDPDRPPLAIEGA
jgi:hypothetical protein